MALTGSKAVPPPTTLTLRANLRAAAAANKKAASNKKERAIAKAARVEERMDAEDRANDQDGNNPPPTTMKKVLRPRPEPEPVEMDPGNDGGFIDPVSPGPGSSDDLQPNVEEEDQLDLSEDEEHLEKTSATRQKKQSGPKKGLVRGAVAAARTQISTAEGTPDSQPDLQGKRKASPVRMSVDLVSDNESVPASEYQDSSEGVGGLESDLDDGDEADYARQRDEEKLPTYLFWQINPLAGIVDTDTIGWVPLRRRKTSGKIKKADIRVRHLPQHLQGDFSKIFTPELIRYAGSLPPWQNIDSVAEMAEISSAARQLSSPKAAPDKKKRKAARTSFADALEANFLSRFACTTACRRIIWDEYFQNATKASLDFVLPERARCCEVCDPANFNHWGLGSHVQEIAVST
ncbi:hypothetical protein B0H14DRAFT_3448395 [Mycena olivaceomarginata]|nr:hypothetical protein B0H14DRAFT_3448395 [Mycena olivaceomarginata]